MRVVEIILTVYSVYVCVCERLCVSVYVCTVWYGECGGVCM